MADSHPRTDLNGNPNGDIIAQAFHSATVGKRLTSMNGEQEQFLRGLNGSIHAALDLSETSGLELVSRTDSLKLRVDSNEETTELNYDELYQECKTSQRELIEVQKICIKNSKHVKELNKFIIGSEDGELHYSSVADVENIVETAYKFLDTKPNRDNRKEDGPFACMARGIRKGFRWFCRNAENIKCFLAFIPDASGYGSVLCGGLSIILQAAATYETLDELICGVLDDIKSITEFREYELLEAARKDTEFHRKMSSLYATIFDVLRLVTERVFKPSLNKVAHALFHTKKDGGDLVSLREKMNKRAQDVHYQVNLLMWLVVSKGASDTKYIRALTERTARQIEQLRSTVDSKVLLEHTVIQRLLETPQKDLEVRLSRSDAISCIQEALTSVSEKREIQRGEISTRRPRSPNLGPGYQRKPEIDIEQLLSSQGYPRTMVRDDCIQLCSSRNISGRNHDRQRIRDLTNHPRMQSFIMLDSSMVLMVKGGLGSRDTTLSPTSYSIAKLVTALQLAQQQTHSVVSLAFFCGQHRDDGYSGCRELMITLILQLIDQYREFSTELLGDCERYLRSSDIHGLCGIFENLCFQLPESVILYCILDGLSFFSFPERRLTEIRDIIQRLLKLSRGIEEKPSARIKLLCATPAGCPDIEAVFADWDIIELHNNTTGPSWHEGDWEHSLLAASVASQSTLDQY